MNDLSGNLISSKKLFADDTSLFSVVHDISTSVKRVKWWLEKS